MKTFLKYNGEWFLHVTKIEHLEGFNFGKRLENGLLNRYLDEAVDSVFSRNFVALAHQGLPKTDYAQLLDKYGSLLIRKVGTMSSFDVSEAELTYYGIDFPIESAYDVVVCENDENAPEEWLRKLAEIQLGNIYVIGFFGTRSQESINEIVSKAKYVTFTTTFMDLEWFEKMLKAVDNQTIYGRTTASDNTLKEVNDLLTKYQKYVSWI
jgi:hypothetical protein